MRGQPCGYECPVTSLTLHPVAAVRYITMGKSPMIVGSVVRAAAGTVFVHCEPWLTNQRMLIVGVAEASRSQRDNAKDGRLICGSG